MARPRSPKGRARETYERLAPLYPGTAKELCELDHTSAFELLTATILSAQTTDARVNLVTPELFRRWPTPEARRKTANVIRSVALGEPGLPVDTHVLRLSKRLGLTEETDPVKVEHALGAMLKPDQWGLFSERVILHGRRVCDAKKPRCGDCVLNDFCPSAFKV